MSRLLINRKSNAQCIQRRVYGTRGLSCTDGAGLRMKIREIVTRELDSHLHRRVYLLGGSTAACWEVTTGIRGVPSQDKSVVNERSPSDVVEIDDGDVGVGCHNE